MLAAHWGHRQMSASIPQLIFVPFGPDVLPVKLVFSFYLSYPLAGLLKRIPDKAPWQKNAFIIA
jgi:hypothetical protein